jgi:transporter family protein
MWAFASAGFAALTAIFGKIGVAGVSSDLATLIRTVVIAPVLAAIVLFTGQLRSPGSLSGKTWTFLVLSGLATGASWVCYYRALKLGDAARVAPIDKLSVVFVALIATLALGERLALRNWIGVGLVALGALLVAS